MDVADTQLWLHMIASTSFMADLLIRSILLVMFLTYGAVSRSSKSTSHEAGRVLKHAALRTKSTLPSSLTPLMYATRGAFQSDISQERRVRSGC